MDVLVRFATNLKDVGQLPLLPAVCLSPVFTELSQLIQLVLSLFLCHCLRCLFDVTRGGFVQQLQIRTYMYLKPNPVYAGFHLKIRYL